MNWLQVIFLLYSISICFHCSGASVKLRTGKYPCFLFFFCIFCPFNLFFMRCHYNFVIFHLHASLASSSSRCLFACLIYFFVCPFCPYLSYFVFLPYLLIVSEKLSFLSLFSFTRFSFEGISALKTRLNQVRDNNTITNNNNNIKNKIKPQTVSK